MGNVGGVQLTWRNGLDGSEAAEVMALLDKTEVADGVLRAELPPGFQNFMNVKKK